MVCPDKTNKAWITMVKQMGEDKAYANWIHYDFNFPSQVRNTSTLKKDLSFVDHDVSCGSSVNKSNCEPIGLGALTTSCITPCELIVF